MSRGAATVLERILEQTREQLERRKRERPLDGASLVDARVSTGRRGFREALDREGIGVIAEFKRRSPSAGELRAQPDLAEIVGAYELGGAVAVSVLTEGPNFEGALEDLRAARSACGLPLLRKDFIVDRYQLYEAVTAGADAVLLIVAALEAHELAALHEQARALDLDVLVEVHDIEELRVALAIGAEIVGINNRDLRDFGVDVGRTEALMGGVPSGVTVVSESGIGYPRQLSRLRELGVEAVLVGESLMRAADPAAALGALIAQPTATDVRAP